MSQSSKIDKKIKELHSRFGGEPVYSNIRFIEDFCLFVSKWKYWLTEGLYYKLKYFFQRHIRGYDDLDKWNVGWYMARKSIPVLKAWRDSRIMSTSIKHHYEDRHGEIVELSHDEIYNDGEPNSFTIEEWKAIIDDIIFAFEFVVEGDNNIFNSQGEEEYKKNFKRFKRGMTLLKIYYFSLWD